MFRFFRRENLRSTRRRSASCPNLEHASLENESHGPEETPTHPVSSSESESDDRDSASKLERLKAQRSIRRVRQKEKEKKVNSEKNLISMDDYLGKLSELKTWLREERKKDVDNMTSPKLKAHFKTFMKLWNKRKLPAKFYKSLSVDLDDEENLSSPVYSETTTDQAMEDTTVPCTPIVPPPPLPRFPLLEDPATPSTHIFPQAVDLSSGTIRDNVASPFSTFGKAADDALTSPAVLAEQATTENIKESNSQASVESHSGQSSSSLTSPQKFATISRSTPSTSLYKFSAQPWSSKGDVKIHPVSSPKCPDLPDNPVATSVLSGTSTTSRTLPHNFAPGGRMYGKEMEKWTAGWNKAMDQSPVYASVIDAIPFSTGSPKYAEIDEGVHIPEDKLSPDYCSISPLQEKKEKRFPCTDLKKVVSKKPSLNRRRSKSMEDIYAVPVKSNIFRERVRQESLEEEMDVSKTPPIPDKKFSPKFLFSTFLGHKERKQQTSREFDVNEGKGNVSSSTKTVGSPSKSPHQSSTQKRRSQESAEAFENNISPLKKTKSITSSTASIHQNSMQNSHDLENLKLNTPKNEVSTPAKLSILTGSLKPTTRNRHKIHENSESSKKASVHKENEDADLSILQVQELEESPKFPRRRLKRRSSSLSTTPGKGLTFGKTSKMATSSPRRVSFAKDVKDTEPKSTPRRRSSSRRVAMPNSATFTRQTQERKEFESFLSSHVSPPKKSNSPSKVSSPDSQSNIKVCSPPRQNGAGENLIKNLSPVSEIRRVIGRYVQNSNVPSSRGAFGLSGGQRSNVKSPELDKNERLFPPSPTKQVGRRVIGTPTRFSPQKTVGAASQEVSPQKYFKPPQKTNSPQKKISPQAKQLSPPKKPFDSQTSLSVPKKSIHSLMSKLTDKTAALCANEVSESEGYSSNDEILNPPAFTQDFKDHSQLKSDYATSEEDVSSKNGDAQVGNDDFQVIQLDTSPGSKAKKMCSNTNVSVLTATEVLLTKDVNSGMDDLSKASLSKFDVKSHIDKDSVPECLDVKGAQRHSASNEVSGVVSLPESTTHSVDALSEEGDFISANPKPDSSASLTQKNQLPTLNQQKAEMFAQVTESTATNHSNCHSTASHSAFPTEDPAKFRHFPSKPIVTDHQATDPFLSTGLEAFEKEAKRWNQRMERGAGRTVRAAEQLTVPARVYENKEHAVHAKQSLSVDSSDTGRSQSTLMEHPLFAALRKMEADDSQPVPVSKIMSEAKGNLDTEYCPPVISMKSSPDAVNKPDAEQSQSHSCKGSVLGKKQGHGDTSNDCHQVKDVACLENVIEKPGTGLHDVASLDSAVEQLSEPRGEQSFDVMPDVKFASKQTLGKEETLVIENQEECRVNNPSSSADHTADLDPKNTGVSGDQSNSKSKADSGCSLERLESIRASPKIVDNDGWITERRRSSRGKKHSFRSAYNKYLLRTSSKEEEEGKGGDDTISSETNSESYSGAASSDSNETMSVSQKKTLNLSQILNSGVPVPGHEEKPVDVRDQIQVNSAQKKAPPPAVKPKPSVMPKTSKGTAMLAQRRLNVGNFVKTAVTNPSPKRRSSSVRKELSQRGASPSHQESKRRDSNASKENYIQKNIRAVRRDSSKLTSAVPKWSKYQQAGQIVRKRSSIGTANNPGNRRRSKGKTTGDENEVLSFTERKKFFQQLQTKADPKPVQQGETPCSLSSKQQYGLTVQLKTSKPCETSTAKHPRPDVKLPVKSPKPALARNHRQLALSPNSEMKI